jgi:hypothetical protein
MKLWKRITAIALCVIWTVLPVAASETASPTLPPIYVGVQQLSELPASWNPMEETDGDQQAVLALTSQRLYRKTADGSFA